ncbi:AAA family ATPase [Vibrio cortegadensis]|uniref:AAA family ATPase n=1 Tax=Vibrio cortegadensis TaxID=1328770 RepID=UPI0021C40A99|nr:ATP-binding protein [Vibrio cortegadensis]
MRLEYNAADNTEIDRELCVQTLTLIRGLPGSGKSTLAKSLPAKHVEADMYFVNDAGTYEFNASKLKQAHEWCQKQTDEWLKAGESVVVANTFVCHWEMKAYQRLAKKHRVELCIIVCRESYNNIHGVDAATVARMKRQWQE